MKRQNEIAWNGHINVVIRPASPDAQKNVSLSDAESKVTMAGRLARSHGGQGSNGLILSL